MVDADWGSHDEPSSFSSPPSNPGPVYSDHLEDVPDVKAARAHGYSPAPEAPMWCFIPAIWPPQERAWVRDDRVRHMTRQCNHGPVDRLPWAAADYADIESETNAFLAELGLPPRPAGRIWLLRTPRPYTTTQDFLDDACEGWQASGGRFMASREFVQYIHIRVREMFDPRP